jgi:hypothetical protein
MAGVQQAIEITTGRVDAKLEPPSERFRDAPQRTVGHASQQTAFDAPDDLARDVGALGQVDLSPASPNTHDSHDPSDPNIVHARSVEATT